MISLHQEIDFTDVNGDMIEFIKKACDEIVEK
jgi:hypothetical protein